MILIVGFFLFEGSARSSQKRPATSPAPMHHGQSADHQLNVTTTRYIHIYLKPFFAQFDCSFSFQDFIERKRPICIGSFESS